MKNVCIVGNSPCILRTEKGRVIDSFPEIVRFGKAPLSKYEKYVGTKTTHRFLNRVTLYNKSENHGENQSIVPSLKDLIIYHDDDSKPDFSIYHKSIQFRKINRVNEFENMIKKYFSGLGTANIKPTGGLAMISYYLNRKYSVNIIGFGLLENLKSNIIPHYYEKKKNHTSHNYNFEVDVVLDLLNKKLISEC